MNYVSIINIIFFALSTLFSIYLLHFIFFAIVGVFHKKRFPEAKEKSSFAVLVSAKDEENVIPRLIQSVRASNYPQDRIDIYIIAHNCSDKTAEVASSLGANTIVYNNPEARTLGYAYQYALKNIDIHKYDGFIVLNADNVVDKNYFSKINDAFVYYNKQQVITSFRHALNIKSGVLPAIYSYYFATSCVLGYAGRESLNVSCRVTGCGFAIPIRFLENGWNFTSITEDIEFSVDSILKGETIHYCDDAIFYDEQPIKFKTMWFQRLRWAKGQNIISRQYYFPVLKALFSKKSKNKTSLYVTLSFISFIPLVYFFLAVLQIIFLLLSPLFGVSLYDAFLYWNYDANFFSNMFMSFNTGVLFTAIKAVVSFIFTSYLTVLGVLLGSRGKYKGQKKLPLILAFIVFPFFIFLQIPLDLTVLFVKEVKWKKIPHGDN